MTEHTQVAVPSTSGCIPILPIPAVYLIAETGEAYTELVNAVSDALSRHWPGLDFFVPVLPDCEPAEFTNKMHEELSALCIPVDALLVGLGLGGLIAAIFQEQGRGDLQVIAIDAPTLYAGVAVKTFQLRRLAFYRSSDSVISESQEKWSQLAGFATYSDLLDDDSKRRSKWIVRLVDGFIDGMLPQQLESIQSPRSTRYEIDDLVWTSMAEVRPHQDWPDREWSGERPRDFEEIGKAMKAGTHWLTAWPNWRQEFVLLKDSRCLAVEPPCWLADHVRARMAGTAEFFARIFGLPKPTWVEKSEYFLPEFGHQIYPDEGPEDLDAAIELSCTEEMNLLRKARSPKEMLRRHVICEARSLTVL